MKSENLTPAEIVWMFSQVIAWMLVTDYSGRLGIAWILYGIAKSSQKVIEKQNKKDDAAPNPES